MVGIAFIEPDGTRRIVDAEEGATFKDAALTAGVAGVIGMCGGYANCGTCHVFVGDGWLDKLPTIEEAEDMMLDYTASDRQSGSRLSCQLVVHAELDGIELTVAPQQV